MFCFPVLLHQATSASAHSMSPGNRGRSNCFSMDGSAAPMQTSACRKIPNPRFPTGGARPGKPEACAIQ
jgi:hypothetical protein